MAPHTTNSIEIRTPEGVAFSLSLAGPISRFLAWAIDTLATTSAILALALLFTTLFGPVRALGWMASDLQAALFAVTVFLLGNGYQIALEWLWQGRTLGKWVLGLRVMDEQGLRLRFSQIAVRNLLRAIDSLPLLYLTGGLTCFFNKRNQRLGDFAANTIVARVPRIRQPDIESIRPHKYNSLRDYGHLAARVRQRVSPEEARIALQALLRRDQLDDDARIGLFEQVRAHFAAMVPFPEEATTGMTDEQYVRNVLDVVYDAKE